MPEIGGGVQKYQTGNTGGGMLPWNHGELARRSAITEDMGRRSWLGMMIAPFLGAGKARGELHRAVSLSLWESLYPSRLKSRFEWLEMDEFLRMHQQKAAVGLLLRKAPGRG